MAEKNSDIVWRTWDAASLCSGMVQSPRPEGDKERKNITGGQTNVFSDPNVDTKKRQLKSYPHRIREAHCQNGDGQKELRILCSEQPG
jgi:hypothetical protein